VAEAASHQTQIAATDRLKTETRGLSTEADFGAALLIARFKIEE
jgi:hypothetical protein